MTSDDGARNPGGVPTLQDLIEARRRERGWSLRELEHRSGDVVRNQRWHQLSTPGGFKEFPEPRSLQAIAEALEFDITTVVLASAASIGLHVRRHGSELAQMLPTNTDDLPVGIRDGVLAIVRAAVRDGEPDTEAPDIATAIESATDVTDDQKDALHAYLETLRARPRRRYTRSHEHEEERHPMSEALQEPDVSPSRSEG